MRFHLGVDVGTTKIAAVVVDSSSGREVVVKAVPNDTETTSAADKARGRSEWDAAASAKRTFECIAAAVRDARGGEIKGIGVTGQMHGMVLLANGSPISPFIGWQDRRCQEMLPGRDVNYIDRMMQLAGVGGFAGTGCTPATGYMASTLFWLAQNGNTRVTKSAARPTNDGVMACFLPDYLVLRLTGRGPVTDPTDAAGVRRAGRGLRRVEQRVDLEARAEDGHLPAHSQGRRGGRRVDRGGGERAGAEGGHPGLRRLRRQPGRVRRQRGRSAGFHPRQHRDRRAGLGVGAGLSERREPRHPAAPGRRLPARRRAAVRRRVVRVPARFPPRGRPRVFRRGRRRGHLREDEQPGGRGARRRGRIALRAAVHRLALSTRSAAPRGTA